VASVNKSGYLVKYITPDEEHRSYACVDRESLASLIQHLTSRDISTFAVGPIGLPQVPYMTIAHPFHIWS